MTIRSDGKEIVWAVFDCDGYECSDLVGIFDSMSSAEEAAERIRKLKLEYYVAHMEGMAWEDSVEIKAMIVGEYELPGDAQLMEKTSQ